MFFRDFCNCDGHQYFFDLAYRLRAVIENKLTDDVDSYAFGMQAKAWGDMKFEITNYLDGIKCGKKFVEADEFHDMSTAGTFIKWARDLKRNVIIVANEDVCKKTPIGDAHVVIPKLNNWLYYGKMLADVQDEIAKKHDSIVMVCAGMAGKVLIDDLYFSEAGAQNAFLDIGSALDPYCGIASRVYHGEVIKREGL